MPVIYRGIRTEEGAQVWREEDGSSRQLDPRNDLRNHSRTGYEWGYGGSGPAQLALALLADATGHDCVAEWWYQRYKSSVVGRLPKDGWEITRASVVRWVMDQVLRELFGDSDPSALIV